MQLQSDVDEYGPVLAILVVIGGLDTRPRLGGLVHHEELGPGTVVKIEVKSKVVVLFHGRKAIKSCNIGAVKAVSVCACVCVVLCVSSLSGSAECCMGGRSDYEWIYVGPCQRAVPWCNG